MDNSIRWGRLRAASGAAGMVALWSLCFGAAGLGGGCVHEFSHRDLLEPDAVVLQPFVGDLAEVEAIQ